jgi:hypothetical protein
MHRISSVAVSAGEREHWPRIDEPMQVAVHWFARPTGSVAVVLLRLAECHWTFCSVRLCRSLNVAGSIPVARSGSR